PSQAESFSSLSISGSQYLASRRKEFVHARLQPDDSPTLIECRPAVSPQRRTLKSALRSILPGLISGAANDDPCAVGTYAQAGAAFGFSFLWTAPFTFPMMAATVYLCSKLSMVTGKGIAGVVRDHYPRWVLYCMVTSLLIANVIE